MTSDLETLWHDYHARIYGYILLRLHDHDVTADLVSCVYLRALVAIRNGNGYKAGNASAWLFTIARSVMIDHWRAWRHMTLVDFDALEDVSDTDATPHEQVETALTSQQLQRAITQLDVNQQNTLRLRLEGYINSEIAAKLGTTEDATKQRVRRGLIALRETLTEAA